MNLIFPGIFHMPGFMKHLLKLKFFLFMQAHMHVHEHTRDPKGCIIPAVLLVQRDFLKLSYFIHQQSLTLLYFYADDNVHWPYLFSNAECL